MKRSIDAFHGLLIGTGATAFVAAALLGATYAAQPAPDQGRLGLAAAGALFVLGGFLYFIGHGLRELRASGRAATGTLGTIVPTRR